jgi:hypothetical protein
MIMRDATNMNVSYVDHTNSAFSLGGLDSSASGRSLASLIKNCIIEYGVLAMPQFSEEPMRAPDDSTPSERED